MKVKLIRSVLVGDTDTMPTRGGTVVDLDDAKAQEFVNLGLAVSAVEVKQAAPLENKMAHAPVNKAKGK